MLALPGVKVGICTRVDAATGVTVIVLPPGATGGVDVGGGAPATRETDCLRADNLVTGPDALVLTGGSAFGLRTADGVMSALSAAGRGIAVGPWRVPIVPAAAIFDLTYPPSLAPRPQDGRRACLMALAATDHAVPEGAQGAGTGARVGRLLGPDRQMPGGQAAVTLEAPDGLRIAAIGVVNAVGSVLAPDGTVLAGPLDEAGRPLSSLALTALGGADPGLLAQATTIAAVLVGGGLTKPQLARVARMAHDGIARAIEPSHTLFDGDTVFAVAVGGAPVDATRAGALAAHALAMAIRRAAGASAPPR